MTWMLLISIQLAQGTVTTSDTFPTEARCTAARDYVLQEMPRPEGTLALSALCLSTGEAA